MHGTQRSETTLRSCTRRSLYVHHWLGMVLIAAGAAIVGAASLLSSASEPSAPSRLHAVSPLDAAMHLHWSAGVVPADDPTIGGDVTEEQQRRRFGASLSPESARALFGDAMVVLAQVCGVRENARHMVLALLRCFNGR
jgi:hypothetical protein